MQSECPIRGELFTASLVKTFLATNVRGEFFIKISPPRAAAAARVSAEFIGVVGSAWAHSPRQGFAHTSPCRRKIPYRNLWYRAKSARIQIYSDGISIRPYPLLSSYALDTIQFNARPFPGTWHASLEISRLPVILPSKVLYLCLLETSNVPEEGTAKRINA